MYKQIYYQFISQLNYNYSQKKLFFFIKKNKNLLKLVDFLYKQGFILKYEIIGNCYKIFLKYNFAGKQFFSKFILISKTQKKTFINKNQLLQIIQKNPLNLYILKSVYGYAMHQEAVKRKLGGELLLRIQF